MLKRKRRLSKAELEEIRTWMESAPQGRKPTIRQIARRYGVNQPSVIKSLGGWKGIRRGKPDKQKKSEFGKMLRESSQESPVKIDGYTTDVDEESLRL